MFNEYKKDDFIAGVAMSTHIDRLLIRPVLIKVAKFELIFSDRAYCHTEKKLA